MECLFHLAFGLSLGRVILYDFVETARYGKLPANQGIAYAQCTFGSCMEQGKGISIN
jgi:hypothetical protein